MEKEQEEKKNKGAWWIPGFRVFSEISTWIAMPIIVALIGGRALDKYYNTKPLFLLISAGLAFIISAYGIIKAVKKFSGKINNKRDK